jgi:CarD family transcriptional regulator
MSTRKKAPKKATNRPSKATKQSSKASASAKNKETKISATATKPAATKKKAAAKVAKTTKVTSRAPVAKAKAATKSSRVAATKSPARADTKKKAAASKAKQHNAARVSKAVAKPTNSQPKTKIISAAKKKSESVKKGQDRLSAKVQTKTVQAKTPTVADTQAVLREAPKVVHAPTPPVVVVAEPVAAAPAPKPVKPAPVEKAPVPEVEEPVVQKAVKAAPRQGFKTNEFVVYPAHGVGQIVAIEEQEVAGFRLELFVITFVKDKMTLRVPTGKVAGVGMRKLAEPDVVKKSLDILLGRARIKRTMWSRRAQEYETKINSGDLTAIAEVVRDLYRSEAQPEQSYSERQLYEAALDRMAREVAVVQKLTESEALKAIDAQLQKNQRRGKAELDAIGAGVGDADVEEAA